MKRDPRRMALEFAELYDKREQTYLEYTQELFDHIRPNVLLALAEFFKVDEKEIGWQNVQQLGQSIIVTLVLKTPLTQDGEPEELIDWGAEDEDVDDLFELQRLMKVVIPLTLLLEEKETIVTWLEEWKKQAEAQGTFPSELTDDTVSQEEQEERQLQEEVQPASTSNEFDSAGLSKEQIAQLLYFQHSTKGTKQ